MTEEMTIFPRTYDFISWLLPLTLNMPRSQRFVVTRRLQDAALNFQELIVEANVQRGAARAEKLRAADAELVKVRLYLRLCERWQWLSHGQYRHASGMVAEIGRPLGGWLKTVTPEPKGSSVKGPTDGRAGVAGRRVQQQSQERPLCVPQQEQPEQP